MTQERGVAVKRTHDLLPFDFSVFFLVNQETGHFLRAPNCRFSPYGNARLVPKYLAKGHPDFRVNVYQTPCGSFSEWQISFGWNLKFTPKGRQP